MGSEIHLVRQLSGMDCGPACLATIANFYKIYISLTQCRQLAGMSRAGTSLAGLGFAAEKIGLAASAVSLSFHTVGEVYGLDAMPLPAIIHWKEHHYVVLHKITSRRCYIADPANGKFKLKHSDFVKFWTTENKEKGYALILQNQSEKHDPKYSVDLHSNKQYILSLLRYISDFKAQIFQFLLGSICLISLQLLLPFLFQILVDDGIRSNSINIVFLVVVAQVVILGSRLAIEFVQQWIVLTLGNWINISILKDFSSRLFELAVGYFDSRNIGEIVNRVQDVARIERYLTQSLLEAFYNTLLLIVFGIVLMLYSVSFAGIFTIHIVISVLWVLLFYRYRRYIDYLSFDASSDYSHLLFEVANGIREIRLQGSEVKRQSIWLNAKEEVHSLSYKSLKLDQLQEGGVIGLTHLRDGAIIFLAASSVVTDEMSLGVFVAIQFILGQTGRPIDAFVGLVKSHQDATIAYERLNDFVNPDDIYAETNSVLSFQGSDLKGDIIIDNVSYTYPGSFKNTLINVSLSIPYGSTLAIVGESGSGKSTLLKLLLSYYKPTDGTITIGTRNLAHVPFQKWRASYGCVLQDGYIFSDSILSNITECDPIPDIKRFEMAIEASQISSYINNLPSGANTEIGTRGLQLSAGQTQRILIARAIYKNPDYIMFDEATNALDAVTEANVVSNLNKFYENKTAIIVAHRLSTIIAADTIAVIQDGRLVGLGTHEKLIASHDYYSKLVAAQIS